MYVSLTKYVHHRGKPEHVECSSIPDSTQQQANSSHTHTQRGDEGDEDERGRLQYTQQFSPIATSYIIFDLGFDFEITPETHTVLLFLTF